MRNYKFDKNPIDIEKPLKQTFGGTYFINRQIVERIKSVYRENVSAIKSLPQNINNESRDGYFQDFSFGTKKITCLNISNKSEEEKNVLRILADIRNIIDSLTPESEWHIKWDRFSFLHKI